MRDAQEVPSRKQEKPPNLYSKEAVAGSDFETANAAKTILDEFQWGLYPDIPKEIRDRIEEFRLGSPEQRRIAIAGLYEQKPIPFRTIRRLAAKEDDAEQRQLMFQSMNDATLSAMPALLSSGALDAAEEMLELTLAGAPELAGPNYAALMYLRGKLDGADRTIRESSGDRTERMGGARRKSWFIFTAPRAISPALGRRPTAPERTS